MNEVGFGDVGPHICTKKTPLSPPEVTSDALSHFDVIYRLNKNKSFILFGERLCRTGGIEISKSNAHIGHTIWF